jgi:hypothetical protein
MELKFKAQIAVDVENLAAALHETDLITLCFEMRSNMTDASKMAIIECMFTALYNNNKNIGLPLAKIQHLALSLADTIPVCDAEFILNECKLDAEETQKPDLCHA